MMPKMRVSPAAIRNSITPNWTPFSTCSTTGIIGRGKGLGVLPDRRAFGEEGVNAFRGVAGQHVPGHDLGGVAVGLAEAELGLGIECLLADRHGRCRFC